MNTPSLWRRRLVAPILLLVSCSQSPVPTPTKPSGTAITAGDGGQVGASAAGDERVGSGPLDLVRLRMDRQTSTGSSILRQYANPGQIYSINAGETIELWAEWEPTTLSPGPKFKVDWGDGSVDNIGCGSCLLKHAYSGSTQYTVRASLDDRVSTMVTRTFFLNARIAPAAPQAQTFTYSQTFTNAQAYLAGSPQFDGWGSFLSSLNSSSFTFTSTTFTSSISGTVLTCSDPTVLTQLANGLRGAASVGPLVCNGHSWNVGVGCGPGSVVELYVDSGSCSCGSAFSLRPQISNLNWGGFGTTCGAPTQTLSLTFIGTPK